MTYENLGRGALNYVPCRYGESKVLFRGPKCKLEAEYVAVLGGTETYGKFIENPYPAMLQDALQVPVANFGSVNSGIDVYVGDPHITDMCSKAAATVIQITGAQNMSNRFYSVHPRRNDRFLRASSLLKTIYRDVDFTDFNFTKHLLKSLYENSPEKFEMVREELREAWVARMRTLIARIEGPVILMWLAGHSPDHVEAPSDVDNMGADPLFVDRAMLKEIRPLVFDIIEVVGTRDEVSAGFPYMVYSDLDAPSAREMLGPVVHLKAAEALSEVLRKIV